MSFFSVALGGAIGAVGRYAISLIPVKTGFPFQTLITNILGAVLIGFIMGLVSQREDISHNTVLFWKTGVCGGFTTFSTFINECGTLVKDGNMLMPAIYLLASLAVGFIALLLGNWLSQAIIK